MRLAVLGVPFLLGVVLGAALGVAVLGVPS